MGKRASLSRITLWIIFGAQMRSIVCSELLRNTMDELIEQTSEVLGISPGTAREAVGALLSIVRLRSDDADFRELLDRLPGARALMSFAEVLAKRTDEGGGIIGGGADAANELGGAMGRGEHSGLALPFSPVGWWIGCARNIGSLHDVCGIHSQQCRTGCGRSRSGFDFQCGWIRLNRASPIGPHERGSRRRDVTGTREETSGTEPAIAGRAAVRPSTSAARYGPDLKIKRAGTWYTPRH